MYTEEQLKSENPKLYHVAREHGTEPPFSGKYVNTNESGTYHCAVCSAPLFSSDKKFKSGSGWPSFIEPLDPSAVRLEEDSNHGMRRMEVRCGTCDAHLGHVFSDGPQIGIKVSDRYCINSISLDLKQDSL